MTSTMAVDAVSCDPGPADSCVLKMSVDGYSRCALSVNSMGATAASERILRELATSIGALSAAIEMDIDRSGDDRLFFVTERSTLQSAFDKVITADHAVTQHLLLVHLQRQAAVVVGDQVLDRGVRAGKSKMRIELRNSTMPGGEDQVFPSDISEITDAERRVEPNLVLGAVAKWHLVPEFTGKADIKADLEGRVDRQQKAFANRDASDNVGEALEATLELIVSEAEEALFVTEKHLEARFPRDAKYVASFFMEKPSRKKKKSPVIPPPATPV